MRLPARTSTALGAVALAVSLTLTAGSVSAALAHRIGQIPHVRLGDVDVEHRLVDPLVAHPRLQAPRVHMDMVKGVIHVH